MLDYLRFKSTECLFLALEAMVEVFHCHELITLHRAHTVQ